MNFNKCYLIAASRKSAKIWAKTGSYLMRESNSIKLVGVTVQNQLKSDNHISISCDTTYRKLFAISKITHYLIFHQQRTITQIT